MSVFKFKSLTMRIWTTFTAVILVIICSISFLYLVTFKRYSEKAKIQDLKVAHEALLKDKGFEQPFKFDKLKNLRESDHFILYKDENNRSNIIDIPKNQGLPPPPISKDYDIKIWMAKLIQENHIYEKEYKRQYNNREFIFIVSSINDENNGRTYLISYMPNRQDNNLLYSVIIIGIFFIGIGFFTARVVARNIGKPLKELENYTIRIAHKDWKEPIEVNSNDEIGRLAKSMNIMQKELKRADEEEKMFLQSISHDLKTPVMVIMSHAEAIIDGVYIDTVEKTAEIIRDEAIALEKKIKQLLYLNTLDYVLENNSENVEINLRDLILNIISRFELINSKIQWELSLDVINIKGNADKIKVAVENILDNGLRYAEGKICITLRKESSFAILEIYNDGPKIEEEHIRNIFNNFYKDKTGNFGLGLAISKKIIDFYKGEISAVNRERGVSFIIKYPI